MAKTEKIKLSGLRRIPVMQNMMLWLIPPLVIIFAGLIAGTVYQVKFQNFFNIGIDFAGGSVLTVEIPDNIDFNKAKDDITAILTNDVGIAEVNEPQVSNGTALIYRYTNKVTTVSGEHTSANDGDLNADPEAMTRVNEVARDAIVAWSNDTISRDKISADLISSQASSDLIRKAILAVVIALAAIFIYILIRFDFFSGLASVTALVHDVIMMFAIVIIARIQINMNLMAGILTIIAYSINDSIILFDMVRDRIKPNKRAHTKVDVVEVVDSTVNALWRRATFTTITTLVTIIALASIGVQSLTEFAVPIIVGLVCGVYSTMLIAPALWGTLIRAQQNKGQKKSNANFAKSKSKKTHVNKVSA